MKPKTRLLIRLTFSNGDMRGWGYDWPHYPSTEYLQKNLEEDFADLPEHTECHLFYYDHETDIEVESGDDLAKKTMNWLKSTGDYN